MLLKKVYMEKPLVKIWLQTISRCSSKYLLVHEPSSKMSRRMVITGIFVKFARQPLWRSFSISRMPGILSWKFPRLLTEFLELFLCVIYAQKKSVWQSNLRKYIVPNFFWYSVYLRQVIKMKSWLLFRYKLCVNSTI